MATCSRDLEMHPQTDCSPHGVSPWLNATEDACRKLGCCWHAHGLVPTGHMCVHQSYNSSSGCCESIVLSEPPLMVESLCFVWLTPVVLALQYLTQVRGQTSATTNSLRWYFNPWSHFFRRTAGATSTHGPILPPLQVRDQPTSSISY
jgi:hypothetical protein